MHSDCQVTTAQTPAGITKTERLNLTCEKNRERSLENNLPFFCKIFTDLCGAATVG